MFYRVFHQSHQQAQDVFRPAAGLHRGGHADEAQALRREHHGSGGAARARPVRQGGADHRGQQWHR